MCGRFILVPNNELTNIINAIRAGIAAEGGQNAAAQTDAWPKSEAPVLLQGKNGLEAAVMRWGFPVSWQKGVVFNTRVEKALAPGHNMWTGPLRQGRCIVPSYGFYEPHRTQTAISPKTGREIKAQYRFTLPGSAVVCMAGVYEAGHFSIMTAAPNRWMRPVHDRMPMVLLPGEYDRWLCGDYAALADRSNIELLAQPT